MKTMSDPVKVSEHEWNEVKRWHYELGLSPEFIAKEKKLPLFTVKEILASVRYAPTKPIPYGEVKGIFPFLSYEGVPEAQRDFMPDVLLFDSLIEVLFRQLAKRLDVPPPKLTVRRLRRAPYVMEAYVGEVPGTVVLNINESDKAANLRTADTLPYTLLHELLHLKYPSYSESQIKKLEPKVWAEIYPDYPYPYG